MSPKGLLVIAVLSRELSVMYSIRQAELQGKAGKHSDTVSCTLLTSTLLFQLSASVGAACAIN